MKFIVVIIFLFSMSSWALVPIEGLIFGDVQDIKQYDPLSDIQSKDTMVSKESITSNELARFKKYIGLYRQGANLKYSCEFKKNYRYDSSWKEQTAKRSIAATIQYIGLDLSMKAIIKYMKMLEMTDEEFKNIKDNLIENTCSKNISVYSIALLRKNFEYLWENGSEFQTPDIQKSPFFSKTIKEVTNSHKTKKNELNLSLKNFRAFCSWNGDTDNYRMLTPYLKNPFVMSYVFNHLASKKITWNKETNQAELLPSDNTVKVACEDLICRSRDFVDFNLKFPRMIGSTKIIEDLEYLYCGHFKNLTEVTKDQNPKIKNWLKVQNLEDPILESMNFVSLITGFPDLLNSSDKFSDLTNNLKENIITRWDKWAKSKADSFVTDLLYEESLNIDLVSRVNHIETIKGEFKIQFDFSLGEMDRVLKFVDKINSTFHLSFPKSYLRWVRDEYIKKNNISDYKGLEHLEQKLVTNINTQLEKKKDLFLIDLWTDKMGKIMAQELIAQITEYKGSYFKDFSHKEIKVPVEFKYGLFALKYLNEQFKAKYRNSNSKTLTLVKR